MFRKMYYFSCKNSRLLILIVLNLCLKTFSYQSYGRNYILDHAVYFEKECQCLKESDNLVIKYSDTF